MSPLWRDRLIVGLAPDRLTAVRLGKGWRPRPVRRYEVRVDGTDAATPWRPCLAAFQELVSEPHWQTASVDVVLSSHFVRYAVIPADSTAQTEIERAALGAIVFRQSFGNLCQDWRITLSDTRRGLSTLGAAMPSGLIDALRSGIGRTAKIHSIRPDLMEAFNRIRKSVRDDPTIFALIEAGRVTVGQAANGAWTSIVSRLAPADDRQAFARVLEEEAALRPFPETAALWLRDLTGTAEIPAGMSGRVRTVPPRWPGPAAAFLA